MFALGCSVVAAALLVWMAWVVRTAGLKRVPHVQPSWRPLLWWSCVPLGGMVGALLGSNRLEWFGFLGTLGLWGGSVALAINVSELLYGSAQRELASLFWAGLAGAVLAFSLPFVHCPVRGGYFYLCGLPFGVDCPDPSSWWLNGFPFHEDRTRDLVSLFSIGACLLAPQLALLTFRRVFEPPWRSVQEAPRSRSWMDYLLLVATAFGLLLNFALPPERSDPRSIVAMIPASWEPVSRFMGDGDGCGTVRNHSLLLASPLAMLGAAAWSLPWFRRGLTRRGRLLWGLILLIGFLGLPASCFMASCIGQPHIPLDHFPY